MISALRKIEGRGELRGATSAVMEMCIDNPREEFADLFATHPSVDKRVAALVKFAGGHDPGPLALPARQTQRPPEQPPEQRPGSRGSAPAWRPIPADRAAGRARPQRTGPARRGTRPGRCPAPVLGAERD